MASGRGDVPLVRLVPVREVTRQSNRQGSDGEAQRREAMAKRDGATRLIIGPTARRTFPVSRNRAQVAAFTSAASLMIAPAVAGTPIYLSPDPPNVKIDPGPSLSFGRVGPCPGCRTEPNNGLYNFITPKGPRPIEPVPGILLSIPLGNAAR